MRAKKPVRCPPRDFQKNRLQPGQSRVPTPVRLPVLQGLPQVTAAPVSVRRALQTWALLGLAEGGPALAASAPE